MCFHLLERLLRLYMGVFIVLKLGMLDCLEEFWEGDKAHIVAIVAVAVIVMVNECGA